MMSRCLVLVVALVATCSARPGVTEYKCAIDTKCTGNSMQKIMMLGQTMCCPSEAQFNIDAGSCMCLELAAPAVEPTIPEEECLRGVANCSHAASFSRDSSGTLRCCMSGYVMNSVTNSYINGVLMDVCTCTPPGNSGFFGMPSVPSMVDQSSQNVNATEQWRRIRQDWRNIGQDFVGGVRAWADNFGQGMRQTGRDLAGSLGGIFRGALRTSVGPVQRALNDFIAHAFRG